MATYTLIPSSLTGTGTITNASNAYADTSSANYATCSCRNYQNYGEGGYLGGFDFSVIPTTELVVSITCKMKYRAESSSYSFNSQIMSGVDGVALSDEKNYMSSTTATVTTYTLTENVSTILSYADTLCFHVYHKNAGANYCQIYLYGAEIIVETVQKNYSKVVYDGDTLIDLTSDTATASDVASGKIFHLASGAQATGTLSPSVATATTTGNSTKGVSFTVSKEPSWFMMICASTNAIARSYRVQHMLYDGTTTTIYYGNGSTAGSIITSTIYGSFSYSSGTLTITTTNAYIAAADWELYYL